MATISRLVVLYALVAAPAAEGTSHRSLRQVGGRRLQQTYAETNGSFEQVYFAETLGENGTVVLLESGPFKLEASCYTTLKYYHVSNHHDDDFNIDDDSPPSRGSSYSFFFDDEDDGSSYSETRSYTLSYLRMDLTYTADTDDYVFGPHDWYNGDVELSSLAGAWTAGENRTSQVFRGYDGQNSASFTLQSLSGNYFSIDSGDTAGIHRDHTDYIPGGEDAFPEGLECMVGGFFTYRIPAVYSASSSSLW